MVQCCIVPHCKSTTANKTLSFHKFPVGETRDVWKSKLRIVKSPSKHARICSNHFLNDDFAYPFGHDLIGWTIRRLKADAVPSVNLPNRSRKPRKKQDLVIESELAENEYLTKTRAEIGEIVKNDTSEQNIKDFSGRKWCDICKQSYTVKYFPLHIKKHMGSNVPSCKQCGKRFLFVGQRNEHVAAVHSKKQLYPCSYCTQFFTKPERLIQHEKSHSGIYSYQCKICSARFRTQDYFSEHLRICFKLASENPLDCEETFSCQMEVAKHVKLLHSKKTQHQCSYCEKSFTKLNYHLSSKHNDHEKYERNRCGRSFKCTSHLTGHVKSFHLKEKLHRCSYCEKEFSRRSYRLKHEKLHCERKQDELVDEESWEMERPMDFVDVGVLLHLIDESVL